MNLLCDEGVDRPIVSYLREQGHSIFYVAELEPGVDDQFVLSKSAELNAPLVTTDKDFGELVFRQKLTSAGVILLRLAGLTPDAKQRQSPRPFGIMVPS